MLRIGWPPWFGINGRLAPDYAVNMGGRNIRIFLLDGIPNGMISAEIVNWTGRFMVAPRSQLNRLAKRDEVKRSGVYFLKGSNPKDPS